METVKEKLMHLLDIVPCGGEEGIGGCPDRKFGNCKRTEKLHHCTLVHMVDNLLNNGVTIATDTNAGDKSSTPDEWVSVDERLPEEDENIMPYKSGKLFLISVLAYGKDRGVRIVNRLRVDKVGSPYLDKYATDGWEWSRYNEDITHWMPLPQPPKRGGCGDGNL